MAKGKGKYWIATFRSWSPTERVVPVAGPYSSKYSAQRYRPRHTVPGQTVDIVHAVVMSTSQLQREGWSVGRIKAQLAKDKVNRCQHS